MIVRWFAHLPGVSLGPLTELPVRDGRLVHLTFDEWQVLDGEFDNERAYGRARPLFYAGSGDLDAESRPEKIIPEIVRRFHDAVMLALPDRIVPAPELSITYMQVPISHDLVQMGVMRRIGAAERDWIVFGSPVREEISPGEVARVTAVQQRLEGYEEKPNAASVDRVLSVLRMTMQPEFWWSPGAIDRLNDFIHCMAAMEDYLLPEEGVPAGAITQRLGQHASALLAESFQGRQQMADYVSELYRLRTRLIHGEISAADLTPEMRARLTMARPLLANALLRSVLLNRRGTADPTPLPELLGKSWKNERAFDALHLRLKVGNGE
jgi:hypothetical protein